jgi:hypothetical protein
MTELEALKERVRILEQRSRRSRIVGIGLALLIGALVTMGQTSRENRPAFIRANAVDAHVFTLTDLDGKTRAVLSTKQGGWPKLEFLDKNGKTRLELYSSDFETAVTLSDPQNEMGASLFTGASSFPSPRSGAKLYEGKKEVWSAP